MCRRQCQIHSLTPADRETLARLHGRAYRGGVSRVATVVGVVGGGVGVGGGGGGGDPLGLIRLRGKGGGVLGGGVLGVDGGGVHLA